MAIFMLTFMSSSPSMDSKNLTTASFTCNGVETIFPLSTTHYVLYLGIKGEGCNSNLNSG